MYVTSMKENVSEETLKIVKNVCGFFTNKVKETINEQSHPDVKLYALVRYLSIVGYEQLPLTIESKQLCISTLTTANK